MQSPWICFANEVRELFSPDPEVEVQWSEDDLTLKLYVKNSAKAEAISDILPTEKTFGNVTLKLEVIPANEEYSDAEAVRAAFYGNPLFKGLYSVTPIPGASTFNYAVFNKEVIQYYNDNLSDLHGNKTTLAENLAKDVFEIEGVFFCTDNVDPN